MQKLYFLKQAEKGRELGEQKLNGRAGSKREGSVKIRELTGMINAMCQIRAYHNNYWLVLEC